MLGNHQSLRAAQKSVSEKLRHVANGKSSRERRSFVTLSKGASKRVPPVRRVLPWGEIPHRVLWMRAQQVLDLESPSRAMMDSLQSVLTLRLHRMDPVDHRRYIEIECGRIVEALRALRDVYRDYLGPKVDASLVEMNWVIVRFGIKDWAVMRLRESASRFVVACRIQKVAWDEVYGISRNLPYQDGPTSPTQHQSPFAQAQDVEGKIRADVFDEVMVGGPFGQDAQLRLARRNSGLSVGHTFPEAVERRRAKWDSHLWTEGLARLYDAACGEVIRQLEVLGKDGIEAESELVRLSPLERIAYTHLYALKSKDGTSKEARQETWIKLLIELDTRGVRIDDALSKTARAVLLRARQKGNTIETWTDCYARTAAVIMEDGTARKLRREVTHSLHNAAKKAHDQMRKIWGRSPRVKSAPAAHGSRGSK